MRVTLLNALTLVALLVLVGCTAPSEPMPEGGYGEAQPLVDMAKADLQERLSVSPDEIAVQSVEATEFPDASLGVPEAGKMYAQVITPGYIIRLIVDGTVYEYHGSGEHVVFAPHQMAPEEVVASFYNWYLGYIGEPASEEMRNPLVDRAYRSSEYLTEEFIQKVDGILDSFVGGGYDPFLCAQDIPGSFTVDEAVVSGEEASVVVHEIWNPGTQYERITNIGVHLRLMDGQWKIADIMCGGGASAATPSLEDVSANEDRITGWQVFRDDQYEFQIQYPADWTLQEARIDASAGDIPLERVLGFSPQDWESQTPAVSIEVGVGNLEEMSMWPVSAANKSSATIIRDYTVLVVESPYGEMFYIFEHPTDSNLRVALRDYTGFTSESDSVEGNELKNIVNQMLATFKFTE